MDRLTSIFLAIILLLSCGGRDDTHVQGNPERTVTLQNDRIAVSIGTDGSLQSLINIQSGHDYASGGLLWRLYYDSPDEKEIQISGSEQTPQITYADSVITLSYASLKAGDRELDIKVSLTITVEHDKVRFGSTLVNNEPKTVIRELHYPLLHGAILPEDHKLYTSEAGGKLFADRKNSDA